MIHYKANGTRLQLRRNPHHGTEFKFVPKQRSKTASAVLHPWACQHGHTMIVTDRHQEPTQ